MIRTLHSIACHAYGLAAVLYLTYLIRQWKPLPTVGRWLVGLGMVLQTIALASWLAGQGGALSLAQGCSTFSLLLLIIFFLLDLRYRLPVLGAFLVPLALAALVPALLVTQGAAPLPPGLRQPLLPVHVSVALLGVAAFAGAAAVGLMYLLQERQVKAKHFGVLFSRLPSLQFLDELNQRLVLWGFIALSVTLVTGAFFVSGGRFFWQWEPKEVATLVAWLGFGALLNARMLAGWRGKRVAWLTMAGFCLLVVSFVSSFEAGARVWGH